jgi:hypothetical protein
VGTKMLKLNRFGFLLLPEDALPGSGSKQSMIDYMAQDDDEKPEVIDLEDKKEKETPDDKDAQDDDPDADKEDKEEKEDELSEFDEEDEPDDEKLELVGPVRKKEILKKYPEIFKDFPYLERAYYREQQFTEVFPTPADAREAAEKAESLDNLEQSLTKGESKDFLSTLKESNENGYYKFIDNLLPTLAEQDGMAYGTIIGNIIKHSVRVMSAEGNKINSEELKAAAHVLYKFTFGNSDWEEPKPLAKPDTKDPNDPNKAAEEREAKIAQREFERSRDSINTKVNSTLKATIDANIDPKDQMSPYVKKQATREAFEAVSEILNNDTRLRQVLDRLWERARKSDFAESDLNAIRSAVKTRAASVLPAALKKARIDALKGMGKRTNEKADDDVEDTGSKRDSAPQTHRRQNPVTSRIKDAKDIPRGMSTFDFLNSD